MPTKTEPLPCPFCGTLPTIEPWHGGPKTKRMVACDGDECNVQPKVTGRTRKVAVERWNQRAANREIVRLRRERLQLAKLAHPEPQFDNPIVAWEAQALRDRVLREAAHAG